MLAQRVRRAINELTTLSRTERVLECWVGTATKIKATSVFDSTGEMANRISPACVARDTTEAYTRITLATRA